MVQEWGGIENREMGDGFLFPSAHCLENGELVLSEKVLSSLTCVIRSGQIPSERVQLLFLSSL